MAASVSQRRRQARPQRVRLLHRWRSWQHHHGQSAADSLSRVLQQPLASLMTWLVIGVAIALPAALWIALDNLAGVSESLRRPARLSVFLSAEADGAAARSLLEQLLRTPAVAAGEFVDRDDAMAEFVERSGLQDVAAGLPENPLPHLLLIEPADERLEALESLRQSLAADALVDEVVIDMLWLQRLQSMMAAGRRGVQLLALLLLSAVVLVLGNTIRLAIENRRDEIVIVKLVGGSDAFVRRPLLYTGLWFGLGGGVVAALLLAIGTALLAGPVNAVAQTYGSALSLRGLNLVDSLQLILLGGGLGLLGAWLAVARHLRDIEPR